MRSQVRAESDVDTVFVSVRNAFDKLALKDANVVFVLGAHSTTVLCVGVSDDERNAEMRLRRKQRGVHKERHVMNAAYICICLLYSLLFLAQLLGTSLVVHCEYEYEEHVHVFVMSRVTENSVSTIEFYR